MCDSSLVDREKAQALPIKNPHRQRVIVEQQPERLLAALCLCHILVSCHPSAVCNRPMHDGDVAPVTQSICDMIWLVCRYFVDPIVDVAFMIVRRVTTGNPMLQNRAQRRTRPGLLLIQSI